MLCVPEYFGRISLWTIKKQIDLGRICVLLYFDSGKSTLLPPTVREGHCLIRHFAVTVSRKQHTVSHSLQPATPVMAAPMVDGGTHTNTVGCQICLGAALFSSGKHFMCDFSVVIGCGSNTQSVQPEWRDCGSQLYTVKIKKTNWKWYS